MIRRNWIPLLLIAPGIAIIAGPAAAQSFNCRRAFYADERAICRSPQLAKLDDELAALFGRAINAAPANQRQTLSQQETQWVVSRRHCRDDDACIEQSYRDRLAAVSNRLGNAAALAEPPSMHAGPPRFSAVGAGVGSSSPTPPSPQAEGLQQNPAPEVTIQFR